MRLINRIVSYSLRNLRTKRQTRVQPDEEIEQKAFDKLKFSEEELTQMGQYSRNPKARHYKDIFKERMEEKISQQYLRNQKQDIFTEQEHQSDDFEPKKQSPKMQRPSKQQKRQTLRTFKIYKHIDKYKRLKDQKQSKIRQGLESQQMITQQERLQQLSRVRLNEQYLPYEYMKNVQKVFHKYDQTKLRNIAFHFTNAMKLRYNEQKIDYEKYQGLQFQRLEDKLPYHRKVQQIYLTSKEKALQVREQSRKVQDQPQNADINYTQNVIISYLLNRAPRTYAVAFRTLHQIKKRFEGFKPKSFIDFGAGLSTGSAAFIQHFGDTGSIYSVQPANKMRKVAKYLTAYSKIIQYESLAELSSQVKQVDIVYCGYVINELKPDLVPVYLEALLAKVKPQGFLILTEYGNPFGARLMHQSRRWALTKKIKIVAPCPHHLKCPLSSSKHWCHFDQPSGMLPREVFGKLPSQNTIKNEKFSYLIIQKLEEEEEDETKVSVSTPIEPNESEEWDRVLFPLMKKGGHFVYTLCTRKGRFQKRRTAKSHGHEFKVGRKLKWGDLWRFGFRIPNRFRKQRSTGRRLW